MDRLCKKAGGRERTVVVTNFNPEARKVWWRAILRLRGKKVIAHDFKDYNWQGPTVDELNALEAAEDGGRDSRQVSHRFRRLHGF